jgi:hypothetical protein
MAANDGIKYGYARVATDGQSVVFREVAKPSAQLRRLTSLKSGEAVREITRSYYVHNNTISRLAA